MPPLSQEEYEALKADIAERGVQVPVEYDEQGNILDGHHRVQACKELGIKDWPSVIRCGMSEEDKIEHALTLNLSRRHLSREQRQELVVKLRGQGWSLRRIAAKLGVSDGTVRNDLEGTGAQNYAPDTITGADGKQYPATRPSKPAEALWLVPQPTLADEEHSPLPKHVATPHVIHNSGNNEWYTPLEYIEAARAVMGGIDLDPASTAEANKIVKATRFYDVEDDGLQHPWAGRVWLNPPYSSDLIGRFCDRLATHVASGAVPEAIVLVNNATETSWFNALISCASAIVFPRGRVKFWGPHGQTGAPLQGQALIYCGPSPATFLEVFACFGWGARL